LPRTGDNHLSDHRGFERKHIVSQMGCAHTGLFDALRVWLSVSLSLECFGPAYLTISFAFAVDAVAVGST
jgi:hypothetical protein